MNSNRILFAAILMLSGFNKISAQAGNCHAYFTYSYQPGLSQPEQDIYLFSDSSAGEDSSTKWEWSLGPGDFSAEQNPSFTYEPDDSGFEQVCLTIHNTGNGCTSTWCDTIRVDNLCIGARYSYTMQGNAITFIAAICGQADSINWNFGDGTSATGTDTVVHTYPATVDSYYVCMKVYLGSECQLFYPCKAIDCQTLYVYPTSVNTITQANEHVKVFPDPASSRITINTDVVDFPAQISITDVAGNTILQSSMDNAMQQILINDLQAGIYFIQLTNGQKQNLVTRFVKQ
jgi:hypothetical protein